MNRKLDTLSIRDVRHLCRILGTSQKELESICVGLQKEPYRFYRETIITTKEKRRHLATPTGRFRLIVDRLNGFLQRLRFPDNMHGGLKTRSARGYAGPHVRKCAILISDINDFFPSIHPGIVYRTFLEKLGCSPDVSHYLTRLTTFNGQLPQGSPTSTIVANIVSMGLANRLRTLADSINGVSGTFVDDIVISGPPYVGNFQLTIKKIICQEGFRPNEEKTRPIQNGKEQVIAGIRVNNRLDAPSEKIRETRRLIDQARADLALGIIVHPSILRSIQGKIRYIDSLNPGAAKALRKRFRPALIA